MLYRSNLDYFSDSVEIITIAAHVDQDPFCRIQNIQKAPDTDPNKKHRIRIRAVQKGPDPNPNNKRRIRIRTGSEPYK